MKNSVPRYIICSMCACILLQNTSLVQGASSALQKGPALEPTKELEKMASQDRIYYDQIAKVGRLVKDGAYPFIPSDPEKKSACSLLFENNCLWFLLGTISESLPDRRTLPETMVMACTTVLDEHAKTESENPPNFDFLARLKETITWGLHKNPKMMHLNNEPLFSLMIYLCSYERPDDTLKQNLSEFIEMLEVQQLEQQNNQNASILKAPCGADTSEEESSTDYDVNNEETFSPAASIFADDDEQA